MGAPIGNHNASRAKIFRDGIKWALEHYEEEDPLGKHIEGPVKAVRKMCLAQVKKAADDNDLSAFRELADRVDGKASQTIEGPGEHGEHTVINKIEEVIIDPHG